MKRILPRLRVSFSQLLVIALLLPFSCVRANKPLTTYTISGQTCVAPGTTYGYSVSPVGIGGTYTWTIQGGTITSTASGSNIYSVNVIWNTGNITREIFLQVVETSTGLTYNASPLNVYLAAALTGGSVTNSSQNINYNSTPSTINCTSPTGGDCSPNYTYKWQYSSNATSFSTYVPNATGSSLSFSSPLTQTTYYRREVTETNSNTVQYSTVASVLVYPIVTSSVSPASKSVNYNTSPGLLTGTAGGGTGTYTYKWEQAPASSGPWSNTGATTSTYTPPNLTTTTYYHLIVTSNGASATSSPVTITVYAQISSTISPSNTYTAYNTSPGIITNTVSGGSGSYTYQWQSSLDNNNNFTNISGATAKNYTPGNLTQEIFYRVNTTSNGVMVTSNVIDIKVYPPIEAGTLPGTFNLSYGGSVLLYDNTYSGGDGNYVFQWQKSSNGTTWSNISGATSNQYAVTSQTSMYYRLKVTSVGTSDYTNAAYSVLPLYGGIIGSSTASITSGGGVTLNSLQTASGNGCSSYTYQWQKSTDENNWTNISGTTVTGITTNTYFRRLATCGSTASSNIIRVKVQPTTTLIKPTTATSAPAGTQTAVVMPSDYNSVDPNDINYVRERDFTKPGVLDTTTANTQTSITDVHQVTQFFDGLGRPTETVAKQQTPGLHDLISLNFYDQYGRESQNYLSYSDNGTSGAFRTDATTKQPAFYNSYLSNTEAYYYSNKIFDASPLNTALKTTAPGKSWTGQNVGTSQLAKTNDVYDSVIIWNIGFANDTLPVKGGYYDPGTLQVNETTDEQNNEVLEYKDLEGQIILKKVEFSDSLNAGHVGWLCTYYVYDDMGNLRTVIPPLAVAQLQARNWAFESHTLSGSTIALQLCFNYQYDTRKRMVTKEVPGAREVWMVYDARDRLVMTQDSVMRAQSNWLYTDYDSLNRPVLTGMWNTTGDRDYHQNLASNSVIYPSPSTGNTILTQTYYDDYSWVTGSGSGLTSSLITTYNTNTSYFYTASNTSFPYPQSITSTAETNGLVTGTKVNVIGSSTYLYSVNFYDDRDRLIQSQSTNYSGGNDTSTIQYSFAGQVLRNLACHAKSGTNPQSYSVLTKTFYDANNRISAITKKISNSLEDTIASNSYDELGQLSLKKIGLSRNSVADYTYTNQPLDTLRYSYNIRGWLRGINKDYTRGQNSAVNWFGEDLSYDFGFTAAETNGNIAGIRWKNGSDNTPRAYGFEYDNVNRLTEADFAQYSSGTTWDVSAGIDYSVHSINYDLNGNILSLNQMGAKLSGSVLVDSLIYNYTAKSNKLNYVTDIVDDTSAHLGDFTEIHNNTTADYTYDANGNLTKDNNKNISSITYNFLNLPNKVTVTGEGSITYTYDATGNKLQKQTVEGSKTTTTLYLGGFNYINDTLQYISTEEGRARQSSVNDVDTFYYDFFERDHLGNIRTVLTDQEQQDVYPTLSFEGTTGSSTVNNQNAVWSDSTGNAINVTNIRTARPSSMGTTTTNGSYTELVKKTTGSIGATKLLKVMAGDQLNVSVDYYYTVTNSTSSNSNGLNAFLNSIAGAILGSSTTSTIIKNGSGIIASNQSTDPSINNFFSPESGSNAGSNNPPKAYLHILLFDERFVFDQTDSYVQQVSYSPGTKGTIVKALMPVKRSGYAYIYYSNESDDNVYFDNFNVTHIRGPLLETTDYYPFGLSMNSIGSKALNFGDPENNKLYNKGSELQHHEFSDGSGLELYSTEFRSLDPQLGRWWQIDPKCEIGINPDVAENDEAQDEADVKGFESMSPYVSMGNNPVKHNDPNGDLFGLDNLVGAVVGAVVEVGTQVISNAISGEKLTNISWGKVGTAAVEGFVTDGASNITKAVVKVGVAVANSYIDNHGKGATAIVKGAAVNLAIDKVAGSVSKLAKGVGSKQLSNVAEKVVGSKSKIIDHIVANNNISHKTASTIAKVVNSGEKALAKQIKGAPEKVVEKAVGTTLDQVHDKINKN